MTETNSSKLSADLMISKRFRYTPIFKNSFYNAKQKPRVQRCICCHSKPCRIIGYVLLVVLFLLALTGSGFLWGTDFFQATMIQNLVLKNNSQAFEWWKKPPVKPTMNVYIFNYTNVDKFLAGKGKLHVQQVGPYSYRETLQKVNVKFHPNGSISYQEKHTFEFIPEMSVGYESDKVVVPNLPLLSAVSQAKDQNIWLQLGLATLLATLQAEPFVRVSVGELVWGYDDPLFTMGRSVMSFKEEVPYKRFGLLMTRNGTFRHIVTVDSGINDISRLGVISHYNGQDSIDFWGSDECNRIDGTEGAIFPPHLVHPGSTLHVYQRDMCRRFPIVFKEHSEAFKGIPTLRFHQPRDVFATAKENPDNACYCHPHTKVCPPSGVFNASPCAYNAPVMVSFPHFFLGDPSLLDAVDGLQPNPEIHDSYVDMHPKLGVPLAGWTRMQLNMMIRKSKVVKQVETFHEGDILPIAWFELGLTDLPEEIKILFYHATFSTRVVQIVFMYGMPLLTVITGYILYRYTCRKVEARNQKPMIPLTKPICDATLT